MTKPDEASSFEQECADLNGEAVMMARKMFKELCGVTTAFFDDSARVVAVLASRAIIAGLHDDIKNPITKRLMEVAAERHRSEHEGNLGRSIPKPPVTP